MAKRLLSEIVSHVLQVARILIFFVFLVVLSSHLSHCMRISLHPVTSFEHKYFVCTKVLGTDWTIYLVLRCHFHASVWTRSRAGAVAALRVHQNASVAQLAEQDSRQMLHIAERIPEGTRRRQQTIFWENANSCGSRTCDNTESHGSDRVMATTDGHEIRLHDD